MSKPAQKEPSMDEILSSIRQIIADDDADGAHKSTAELISSLTDSADALENVGGETLALSQAQIVKEEPADEASVVDFSAFVAETAPENEARNTPTAINEAMNQEADMAIASEMKAEFVDPDDVAFDSAASAGIEALPLAMGRPELRATPIPAPTVRQRPGAGQAAPMPDLTLSRDIAEELLEPATNAAVRSNFSKLNNFAIGNAGITIEQVIRDMLRPMLKEWLDEHLPSVVERMVEKEISRISNGD